MVGHCTFAGLVNRALLSIFDAVYKYIRTHYDSCGQLWSTARDELRTFQSLMFCLCSEWRAPWNPFVLSSDASEYGWGLSGSLWTRDEVAAVGRVSERHRWRRMAGRSAREHALRGAGLASHAGLDPGSPDPPVGDIRGVEWQRVGDFPEVPPRLLIPSRWEAKGWGRWRHSEHITILEARALVKSIQRLTRTRYGSNTRQLF